MLFFSKFWSVHFVSSHLPLIILLSIDSCPFKWKNLLFNRLYHLRLYYDCPLKNRPIVYANHISLEIVKILDEEQPCSETCNRWPELDILDTFCEKINCQDRQIHELNKNDFSPHWSIFVDHEVSLIFSCENNFSVFYSKPEPRFWKSTK